MLQAAHLCIPFSACLHDSSAQRESHCLAGNVCCVLTLLVLTHRGTCPVISLAPNLKHHLTVIPQVSWDFYTAAKHGVTILEQQAAALTLTYETHFTRPASVKCSPQTLKQLQLLGPNSGWSWAQWSALLQDPLQYKVPQLKQAARQLSIPVTASKAVLVVNILQAFGLQGPSRVHPQLLRAVLLERCCTSPWVGCEELVHVWGVLNRLSSHEIDQNWPGLSEVVCKRWVMAAAAWRAALHKYAGVCSKQQLVQLEVEVQQLLAERVHRL
jgi:hypothetical protein